MKTLEDQGWTPVTVKQHPKGYYWDKRDNRIKVYWFDDKIAPSHVKDGLFITFYALFVRYETADLYVSKKDCIRLEKLRMRKELQELNKKFQAKSAEIDLSLRQLIRAAK